MSDFTLSVDAARTVLTWQDVDVSSSDYNLAINSNRLSVSLFDVEVSTTDYVLSVDACRVSIAFNSSMPKEKDKTRVISIPISGKLRIPSSASSGDRHRVLTSGVKRETTQTAS